MRHLIRFIFSVLLSLTTLPLYAAVENYMIDPNHSYVLWHINHFGFSNPAGKWIAEGLLQYDETNLQNSSVQATIKVSDMITGLPELDKHLRGKLFFNTDHFPTATFVSTKVEGKDNTITKLYGDLTVKGITKPIALNVRFNKKGINPITNNETLGFSASTSLLRSEFGIKSLLPDLSDQVQLDIEVEAYKPSPQAE